MARLPAPRRRRQLLDTALAVFAERGFHPTSMNEIAEAAGVTKPVLYQHFRSKRDLYREVLADVGAHLLDEITKATAAAAGPREQVELGFAAYFRFVAEHEPAYRVLFGGGARRDEEFSDDGQRGRGRRGRSDRRAHRRTGSVGRRPTPARSRDHRAGGGHQPTLDDPGANCVPRRAGPHRRRSRLARSARPQRRRLSSARTRLRGAARGSG